jgi:hypothetical protein
VRGLRRTPCDELSSARARTIRGMRVRFLDTAVLAQGVGKTSRVSLCEAPRTGDHPSDTREPDADRGLIRSERGTVTACLTLSSM